MNTRRSFIASIGVGIAGSGGGCLVGNESRPSAEQNATEAMSENDVQPGESIQTAVEDLSDRGGVVRLAAGRHQVDEPIRLGDSITLRGVGMGATTLDVQDQHTGITNRNKALTEDANEFITVGDLSLVGPGDGEHAHRGIQFANVAHTTVESVSVRDWPSHCIDLAAARSCQVRDCVAEGAGDDGISISDSYYGDARKRGPGAVRKSQNVVVSRCVSSRPANSCFEVDDGPRWIRFVNCHAHEAKYAYQVHYHDSANSTFDRAQYPPESIFFNQCTVDDAQYGLMLNGNRESATGGGLRSIRVNGGDYSDAEYALRLEGDVQYTSTVPLSPRAH